MNIGFSQPSSDVKPTQEEADNQHCVMEFFLTLSVDFWQEVLNAPPTPNGILCSLFLLSTNAVVQYMLSRSGRSAEGRE